MQNTERLALGAVLVFGTYAANGAAAPPVVSSAPPPPPSSEAPPEPARLHEEHDRTYVIAVRGSAGFGFGGIGMGAHYGGAGEYWITDDFGVGLEAGALWTSDAVVFAQHDSSATFVSPVLAARKFTPGAGYMFFTVGIGYYAVAHKERPGGFCLDFGGGASCPSASMTKSKGVGFNASLGWLGHPSRSVFEVGPVMRVDVMRDPTGAESYDALVTFNLELGFAGPGG